MKAMTLRARRRAVSGIAALAGALVFGPCRATAKETAQAPLPALARRLERQTGGRLGVCVLRTGDGRWTHRADERFPMCSLFKAIAAAGVLARVDRGELRLDRRIVFGRSDLVDHSPATAQRIDGDGMTLAELCDASMTLSDNTAGNLLLRELGGPAGFTAYVRSLGDQVTRLDRWEPELNEAKPGDPQTAVARTARPSRPAWSYRADRLAPVSRQRWTDWLLANRTGDARLRAGVPASWRTGDKTGTGKRGATLDVAGLWPPGRRPMVAAVFIRDSAASLERRNAAIAEVGRALPRLIGAESA